MANAKLTAFIKQQLNVAREDAGECCKFVLKHVNANAKQNEVSTFDCRAVHKQDGDKRETFIEQLINGVEEAAHDDAESLGGHQRYLLLAYFKGADKPLGRCGFRMEAGDDEDEGDEELASEPANAKGLVAQTMRHQEATMRTSIMGHNHMMSMMQRTIDSQQDTINALLKEKFDSIKLIEEMLSLKQERDLEARKALHAEEMKEAGFKKLMLLGPSLVNRVVGKKVLPEETTPMQETLKAFAESLTMEQMEKLQGVLTSEQVIAMVNILQTVTPEDKKKAS